MPEIAPERPETAQDAPKRRRNACVRCGANPRAPELFVCDQCRSDSGLRREMALARRRSYRNLDQRQWLVAEMGWKGGWGRGA